jgi:hypothetical protein
MSIIHKILNREIIKLDDLNNIDYEEYEIVCSLLYSFTNDSKFKIANSKITNLISSTKNKNELDYYKKYPLYYQKLIFNYEIFNCDKNKLRQFIVNYPLNEYVTNLRKEHFLFYHLNIITPNSCNPYIAICETIFNTSVDHIDDDTVKSIYSYKLCVSLGINEIVAFLFVKHKILSDMSVKYRINIRNHLEYTVDTLKKFNDEFAIKLLDKVTLKHDAIMYNSTHNIHYAKQILTKQLHKLKTDPNDLSLRDIIYFYHYHNSAFSTQLEEILINNKQVLINMQKKVIPELLLSIIKDLISETNTDLSDETKVMIQDIFAFDLYNSPSGNVLIKFAGKN